MVSLRVGVAIRYQYSARAFGVAARLGVREADALPGRETQLRAMARLRAARLREREREATPAPQPGARATSPVGR